MSIAVYVALGLMWLFGVIVGGGVGFLIGEHAGTKDTERRWSEAVRRAQDADARRSR